MPASTPSVQELRAFLVAAGLIDSASVSMDYAGALAAAINDFERDTHWEPFLSTGLNVTIKFSPTDVLYPPDDYPLLDLDGGFVSVTSVTVGVTGTNPGTVLTEDTDFFLMPSNAPTKGKPYSWMQFYSLSGLTLGSAIPNSIRVVGKRGYSLTVPDLAFQSMLAGAALWLAPSIEIALSGGVQSWKQSDGTGETFGVKPLDSTIEGWIKQRQTGVNRFRRLVSP